MKRSQQKHTLAESSGFTAKVDSQSRVPRPPRIEQHQNLKFHSAASTVLLIRTPLAVHKIARISFGKDGSIYVSFPYCSEKAGWIGAVSIPPGHTGPVNVRLRDHGHSVSTDVKFSHHRSGIALFSKSGHDVPSTRRQSFPLNGPIGHIFNLQVFQPEAFERLEKQDPRDFYVVLELPHDVPAAISWRAEWRRKEAIVQNIAPPGRETGPVSYIQHRATGIEEHVVFLGQPEGYAMRGHVLLLAGAVSQLPKGVSGSGMAFLGAWNVHEARESGQPAELGGCLAFLYPAPISSSAKAARRPSRILAATIALLGASVVGLLLWRVSG